MRAYPLDARARPMRRVLAAAEIARTPRRISDAATTRRYKESEPSIASGADTMRGLPDCEPANLERLRTVFRNLHPVGGVFAFRRKRIPAQRSSNGSLKRR